MLSNKVYSSGKERKGKERKGKERKGKERKGKERKGKEGLQTTHQEMKSALPTQRKIPIGRNRHACQSNLIT
jgi:hypothetical protein